MRRKDSTRKLARDRAREKKDDLKKQRKDEISKLKSIKKEEILEKLKRADHLSKGNLFKDKALVERVQKELETEFIPDVYDKTMAKLFSEKYYEDADEDCEDELEANKAIDLKLLKD
jgi:protein KRI1